MCLSFLVSKFWDPTFVGSEKSLYVEIRAVFVMIFMVSQLAFGLQLSDPSLWKFPKVQMAES